jgi:hypothetical protein
MTPTASASEDRRMTFVSAQIPNAYFAVGAVREELPHACEDKLVADIAVRPNECHIG